MKYIIITGGVISGLGKGITASSVGVLLKGCKLSVTSIKIDPYLNIDAGMMSPYEHGEVFVLDDGGQVDLDLGNYERFLNITLTKDHNITTGKIYKKVLDDERAGKYLGKTVQMVPHITDSIQEHITKISKIKVDDNEPEICIIELGGTVGDIESMIFLEALRQLKYKIGEENFCLIHVSLIPNVNEQKSKPTQHSVIKLRSSGLTPDLIVCRCNNPITDEIKKKISLFCMIPYNNVISVHNVENLYKVPELLESQDTCNKILKSLKLSGKTDISNFIDLSNKFNITKSIKIGLIGKYIKLKDSYLSLKKALKMAGIHLNRNVEIVWIDAEKEYDYSKVDGILVPGGFGDRGLYGKMGGIKYARINKIPFFGICLGFQIVTIESLRQYGIEATSEEFENTIGVNAIKMNKTKKMILGSQKCIIKEDTLAYKIYKKTEIYERNRHRYEFNSKYEDVLLKSGLIISGKDIDGRVEIVELKDHPFFIACQFHPELKSRPLNPSPIFVNFIKACKNSKKK